MLKKISAFFAALVLTVFACVPAFAAKSPSGNKTFEVTISSNRSDFKQNFSYVQNGENYELTAEEDNDNYTFAGWEIEGEYVIVSGSLTSRDLVIRPIGDVKIKQVFDVIADEDDKGEQGASNKSDKAPQTGNNTVAALAVMFAAAAATTLIAAKKAK